MHLSQRPRLLSAGVVALALSLCGCDQGTNQAEITKQYQGLYSKNDNAVLEAECTDRKNGGAASDSFGRRHEKIGQRITILFGQEAAPLPTSFETPPARIDDEFCGSFLNPKDHFYYRKRFVSAAGNLERELGMPNANPPPPGEGDHAKHGGGGKH